MKGVTSKILIVLGIVLILLAILWWAIFVNTLIKLPDDISTISEFEGEFTYFVDPATNEPLPEGEELKVDISVERAISSVPEEYDSSRAVIKEEVTTKVGGLESPPGGLESIFVLDRKNSQNLEDDRAYDFMEGNEVNRQGSYYPLLPFDTSSDERYPVWKAELGESAESEFIEEVEKEGITVYNFRGIISVDDRKEVSPTYVEILGLPTEVTFEELKPQLQALGLDVDGLVALATQVMSPEDLQALNAALQQSIPVSYYWAFEVESSVEPKTGVPVDIYKDIETVYMELDTSGLMEMAAVLLKYSDDPVLGPALAPLLQMQTQVEDMALSKVLEYNIAQTEETVKSAIEDAKDGAGQINLVRYIYRGHCSSSEHLSSLSVC